MVKKEDVFNLLKDCNVSPNDKVTIHISLRAIGKIENGADGLIDAFKEYLCDGLFIVPTHTWASVNKDNPYYDVNSSIPCIGTLPQIASKRKDGVRSLHPTHSVTVFGKNAEDFVRGEENSATPTPVGGALSRLYEEKGKILLIGVGHERNTYIHAVEERLNVANRLNPNAFIVTIKDKDGCILQSPPFHNHYTPGFTGSVSMHYVNYKKAFEDTGAVTYHKLGNALVYCCDVVKLTDTVTTIWQRSNTDFCLAPNTIPKKYYE